MRFLLSIVLLLASSSFSVWSQPITWIDSNGLVQEILRITRADSKYMEELMELHTHNGELDRAAYNEALRLQSPALYLRMSDFRKIHTELESEDIDAMNFIDNLLTTARDARHGAIWQPQETKTIVDNFYGLKPSTRDYLLKKFPALRSGLSGILVATVPATMVGAPSTAFPTIAPIKTTSASDRSSIEARSLVERAQSTLEKGVNPFPKPDLDQPLSDAFSEVLATPTPWKLSDLKPIFENINEFGTNTLSRCFINGHVTTSGCKEHTIRVAHILSDVLSAAAKLDPKTSTVKQMFNMDFIKAHSDPKQVLQLIQEYSAQAELF